MNVFVPFPDIVKCVQHLDNSRLNKQVSECAQILRCLDSVLLGKQRIPWSKHPAVLMWQCNPDGLLYYMHAAEQERLNRGMNPHKEITNIADQLPYFVACETDSPWWWGNSKIHNSHLHNLQLKFLGLPHGPYFWPIQSIRGNIVYNLPIPA